MLLNSNLAEGAGAAKAGCATAAHKAVCQACELQKRSLVPSPGSQWFLLCSIYLFTFTQRANRLPIGVAPALCCNDLGFFVDPLQTFFCFLNKRAKFLDLLFKQLYLSLR